MLVGQASEWSGGAGGATPWDCGWWRRGVSESVGLRLAGPGLAAVEGVAEAREEALLARLELARRLTPRRGAWPGRAAASPARRRAGSASPRSTWMTRSPRPVPFRCLTPSPYSGMTWPDCVPGRMSTSFGPSRDSTETVAPRAAATIGIVSVQCRSSPCRSKIGCGCCTTSRNRSPGGPPPGPVSPSPASWMCVPSSTPAGILTFIVRLVRTRPSPSHSGQGRGSTVP